MKAIYCSLGFLASLVLIATATRAQEIPNILFCIADDASPHLGAYGVSWVKTPNIDQLAKDGIVFENAYTPTAKCAPSRAAILTGRNPWQLEEGANHQSFFPANYKTFTEALSEANLYVGSQGKFWGPGTALLANDSPRKFGLTTSGGNSQKDDGGAKFRQFLKDRPKDKPFFFWFGSTNPHRPYELDSGVKASKKVSDVDRVPGCWPDTDEVRRDMLDYAVEVELYDKQVGSMLSVLDEFKLVENTLVIVTSDHGMPFPRIKGHNYDASNRIPFVVRWPKGIQKPGRRVSDFVSLVSVAPTILELTKVDPRAAGMRSITGLSLTDVFANTPDKTKTADRARVIIGRERNDVLARPGSEAGLGYPVRGIRKENWLYLHNFEPDRWPCGNVELGLKDTDASPTKALIEASGPDNRFWQFCFGKRPQEELFDLSKDPDCVINLIDAPDSRELAKTMKQELFAQLIQQEDPRVLGRGDLFDHYPTAKNVGNEEAKKAKKKAK